MAVPPWLAASVASLRRRERLITGIAIQHGGAKNCLAERRAIVLRRKQDRGLFPLHAEQDWWFQVILETEKH